MNDMTLKPQIEEILASIGTARRTIQNGEFVDLSKLETDVAALHENIARNPGVTDGMSSEDLMSFLNSIMEGLEQLDRDLRLQGDSIGAETPAEGADRSD